MYAEITTYHRIWKLTIVPLIVLVCIVAAQWATIESADAQSHKPRTLTQSECTDFDAYLNNLGWTGGLDRVEWRWGACYVWAGNTKAPRQRIADLGLVPQHLGGSAPDGWGRACADQYGSFPSFTYRPARSARSVSQQSSPPAAAAPQARSARSVSQQPPARSVSQQPPARSAPSPSSTPSWARDLDCSSFDFENHPSGLIEYHCRRVQESQAQEAAAQPESDPPQAQEAADQPAQPESDPPQAQEAAAQPESDPPQAQEAAAQPQSDPPQAQEAAAQPQSDPPQAQEAAEQPAQPEKDPPQAQEAAAQPQSDPPQAQEAPEQQPSAAAAAPSSSAPSGARNINCAGVDLETNPSGIVVNYCRNQQ